MKSALAVLREIRSRGAGSWQLDESAPSALNADGGGVAQADLLLEQFLEDESIPAAVFHSRALNRRFVLARDEAALEALTEADRALPVLFFGEAEKLRQMGLDGLGALLAFRAEFGPSVELEQVKVADA